MKFGIYISIADPPAGEDLPRCVDEVIEEAKLVCLTKLIFDNGSFLVLKFQIKIQ